LDRQREIDLGCITTCPLLTTQHFYACFPIHSNCFDASPLPILLNGGVATFPFYMASKLLPLTLSISLSEAVVSFNPRRSLPGYALGRPFFPTSVPVSSIQSCAPVRRKSIRHLDTVFHQHSSWPVWSGSLQARQSCFVPESF
jgi:hypothetical protein